MPDSEIRAWESESVLNSEERADAMSKTIRVWHGCRVVGLLSVNEEGGWTSVANPDDGPDADMDVDPFAGLASGKVQDSEEMLMKVQRALLRAGLRDVQVYDAIKEMQNAGILFRERAS